MMKVIYPLIVWLCYIICPKGALAQDIDTTYIALYPQRLKLVGFVGTDLIQLKDDGNTYTPNYPLITGVGVSVKNTIISLRLGYGLFPLNSKRKYGESKIIDLQLHNYWRKFMFDLSLQRYKGLYGQDKMGRITGIYPDMSILQAGGELTYIFNGDQFSAKAAFDQSEKQLMSAGSFLMGGDAYFYRTEMVKNVSTSENQHSENFQLGYKAGYGYSWALGERWLLSAIGILGVNFGNNTEALKDWKIKCYPSGSGRFASSYHKDDWAVGMSVLIGNKKAYPLTGGSVNQTVSLVPFRHRI